MGHDPEHEHQQEATALNDATSSEQTPTGIESVESERRPEHERELLPEDALVHEQRSGKEEVWKHLSIDTHSTPNGRDGDATEHSERHGDTNEEAGHDGSTLSTPVETPSIGSEHASTSMSLFPHGSAHLGPPKKFVSSANINKKFLQKTAAPSPLPAPGKGVIPTIARPASVTPNQSQSRLVTTKLTMVAPALPTPAAGWNKSGTPSGAPSPQPAATPLSAQAHTPATTTPAVPHATIQTAVLQSASAKLATSAAASRSAAPPSPGALPVPSAPSAARTPRPVPQIQKTPAVPTNVWGHPAPVPAIGVMPGFTVDADFPTAAEAARGKRPRQGPSHKAEAVPPAHADTSADAFRGVHLDPNAHHWDEMEDEEDDFLAGEVEFGDGRQYKVETAENADTGRPPASAFPLTRENRFSDDFDRSWPRTAPLPPPHDVSRPGPEISPTGEGQRTLFNERSNRLEPWGRPLPPHQAGRRRESFDEHHHGFPGRDAPPHTLHLLQKEPRSATYPSREPPPPHPGRTIGSPGHMTRQLPPHLLQSPVAHESPLSAVGSGRPPHFVTSPQNAPLPVPTLPPPHLATSISTAPDSASLKSLSPDAAISPGLPASGVDVGELHKMAMHSAAERAKRRRQEEEEERERERDRARRKAQELEERIKAAELEKEKEAERRNEAERAEQERRAAGEKQKESERRGLWHIERPKSPVSPSASRNVLPRPDLVSAPVEATADLPSMRVDSWRSSKPIAPIGTHPNAAPSLKSPSPLVHTIPLPHKPLSPIVSNIPEVLAIGSLDGIEEVDFSEMGQLVHGKPETSRFNEQSPPTRDRALSLNHKSDAGPWRRATTTVAPKSAAPTVNGVPHAITSEPESFSTLPSEVFVLQDETASMEQSPVPRVSVPGAAPLKHPVQPTSPTKHAYREPAMSALDDTMSRIMGALGAMQEARTHGTPTKVVNESPVPALPLDTRIHATLASLETTSHVDRPISPPLAWRAYPVRVPRKSYKHEDVPPSRMDAFLQPPSPASMDILCWVPPVKDMSVRTLSRDDLFHRKTYTRGVVNARVLLPTQRIVPFEKEALRPVVRLPSSIRQEPPVVASAVPRVLLPKSRMSSVAPRDVPSEARDHFVETLSRVSTLPGSDALLAGDLKLTSRSPPPDVSYGLSSSPEQLIPDTYTLDKLLGSLPQRVPRKMPEGVNLVLYKSPSRVDMTGGDASAVRFTVSSELDGQSPLDSALAQASIISPRRVNADVTGSTDKPIHVSELNGDSAPHVADIGLSTKPSEDNMTTLLSSVGQPTGPTNILSPENDSMTSVTTATSTKASATPASGSTPNPWGKTLLPDPEHLKAVWSHPGTSKITENSLKGIADEFPTSLPVSVQELRSEDVDVPSVKNADELPTPAVAEPPARPSFFDPHKSFQQVPIQPASSTSRFVPPPPVNYSGSGLHSSSPYSGLGTVASARPAAAPLGGVRPFPSYAPIVPGHSPSPPIMYPAANAYAMVSPQTISPNMPQRIWVPPQGSPATSYVTTSTQYTPGMMPYGAAGTVGAVGRPYQAMAPGSKAPGGDRPLLLHNPRLNLANPMGTHVSPPFAGMGNMEQMPGFSPPVPHALPQAHVGFPPHQANPPQQMYTVPIGGGRGAVRNTYDGYQPVPSGAFVRPSGW
ncbi:hypothetical protein DACRYDRAFT_108457 [Dacryopinax primogenitus]|uniref:Uncharacterized protein n=1 Tax=Dacryopinax primogenitus (strain DJM 731) TaxID=1858805 RepID=M5FZ04_DACPD|nr:uncharacterized protein DACRYDRAFT_108457 [Dacryopinax primogenitus]EJU01125.1 hypothetical protein DACRYDRAFT_108457 [Dacryopinax primogenitus]